MAHTTGCDRCKKAIEEGKPIITLQVEDVFVKMSFPDGIDLCETCAAAFVDWMNNTKPLGPVERVAKRAEGTF